MTKTTRSVITIVLNIVYASHVSQNWKGLYCGTFVLDVFATHLSTIKSSVLVNGLYDKGSPEHPNAVGALGLAATSVRTTLRAQYYTD
jgi:hypothetical protein